jgi:hypothetical protein
VLIALGGSAEEGAGLLGATGGDLRAAIERQNAERR